MTPSQLESILADPLFNKLKYVGMSGGEPTLRKDLPQFFEVLTRKKPRLKGLGIITNAINTDQVIGRITQAAEICDQSGIPFNVMVSLDGVGEVHDTVRGRQGNFKSAVEAILHFRDKTNIPVSIGCTITKDNAWHIEDVLRWAIDENVYARFRIAEFIQRLYNDSQTDVIRNFTSEEAYNLALFFSKLETTYESSPRVRRTYRNIRQMLLEGTPRSIRCPYQTHAVTLDSRGQLLYCAPKSPVLGEALQTSAQELYRSNLNIRAEILSSACNDCIHDYHAEEDFSELRERISEKIWKQRLSISTALRATKRSLPINRLEDAVGDHRSLILGWFGTETAGDKAVLAEALKTSSSRHEDIYIASLNPFLTRWTVKELGFPQVNVIPTYSSSFWNLTKSAAEVRMVGGPLMHIEELGVVLRAFINAKLNGHRTEIYGCGIGPLDAAPRYSLAVKRILQLCDDIGLRDRESVEWARAATERQDVEYMGDPAQRYVRDWALKHQHRSDSGFFSLYLRDWPEQYKGDYSPEEFLYMKDQFERELAHWIHEICRKDSLRPRLLPMHHFHVGNDDREFNRRFAKLFPDSIDPIIENHPMTLDQILKSMMDSSRVMCMRYHSVVFADTLAIPYIAIDYSRGGKIRNFLNDQGGLDRLITPTQIAQGERINFIDYSGK